MAQRVVLDSGALSALANGDSRTRQMLDEARDEFAEVIIPAPVLAEVTRGRATDAPVNHVIRRVGRIEPTTEPTARTAGRLLADAGSTSTVDALIAAAALGHSGAVVITGDPGDFGALLQNHPEVTILRTEGRRGPH